MSKKLDTAMALPLNIDIIILRYINDGREVNIISVFKDEAIKYIESEDKFYLKP